MADPKTPPAASKDSLPPEPRLSHHRDGEAGIMEGGRCAGDAAPSAAATGFRRRYMMATTAIHKLGDISRDEADLCFIDGERGTDWIGRWVEGFGFIDVRFPKATTRDLTADEIERYDGKLLALDGDPARPMGRVDLGVGGTKRVA